jgi:hypothetical protein
VMVAVAPISDANSAAMGMEMLLSCSKAIGSLFYDTVWATDHITREVRARGRKPGS